MDLKDELQSLIDLVRRRWTRRVALQTTALAGAAAAVPIALAALLERLIRPQELPLLALAIAALLSAATAALAVMWRRPRRPSDRQVARFIEEQGAARAGTELSDSVATAIDAADRPHDPARAAFLPLLLRNAIETLRALPPETLLPAEAIRRATAAAASGLALLLIALGAAAPLLERAVATAWVRWVPGSVRVEVLPGNVSVPAGTALRIRASLQGPRGIIKDITPELVLAADQSRRSVGMVRNGDAFEFTVNAVDRTFSYAVSAGSARSSRYTVTALIAPRVQRIDVHYEYPDFAGLAPRDEQDAGDVYAPAGTRVRLKIHTDKPIAQGALTLTHAPAVPLHAAGARTLEADLTLARDDSYRVRLADTDGLHSAGETEYFIRLMDDRPPDVRILRPSADQQITPLEEVPIEARADDDYGIAKFELVYSVSGAAERVVPFERVTGTNVQKIGARLLAAEDLRVGPGDVITYYARARDISRGKRSTEATSDIFFLEVKPFNGEFVAAQSQAGAGGSDPQLESLIQAQKEIISSTWNVERRSQAGRSADDVKAIAAAQAELKSRAENQLMSRSSRGRGRAPAPQRQVAGEPQRRQAAGDPIADALDAMGRALQQLQTERTRDALTHEMAALNGLLQAQAEVRRRQVTQQANGASGAGSNRAEQDLSALFDKELQRQQRTNYETRPSIETEPDRAQSDNEALDRIRELARRQEDLSRRQAELAKANLSAEEMKRQLEKLTREQSELREQAEELLRRNGEADARARGRSGQQRKDAAGSETQESLRGAVDQMRSAAGELRRDDPGRAAASGQRAAQQLRRLGEQAAGRGGEETAAADTGSPESRQLSDQLNEARAIRERVQRAEQQLRSAEAQARGAAGRRDGREGTQADGARGTQPGRDGRRGQEPAPGDRGQGAGRSQGAGDRGQGGERGQGGGAPGAAAGAQQGKVGGSEVERRREEYRRELQRAEQALARLSAGQPRDGANGATPEEQQFSRSAPGTEAFKQDRGNWDSLRKDLDSALEQYEASVSARLTRTRPDNRFSAGGSERVPDSYRQLIARYFESLAKKTP
jgi:hypothetical protein